ncbi:hypothetical protein ZWY2020_031471 [Hordeum vulgare]|nr:hypothetical protein ZWY2020_031471 [Hordeum vulgare]
MATSRTDHPRTMHHLAAFSNIHACWCTSLLLPHYLQALAVLLNLKHARTQRRQPVPPVGDTSTFAWERPPGGWNRGLRCSSLEPHESLFQTSGGRVPLT